MWDQQRAVAFACFGEMLATSLTPGRVTSRGSPRCGLLINVRLVIEKSTPNRGNAFSQRGTKTVRIHMRLLHYSWPDLTGPIPPYHMTQGSETCSMCYHAFRSLAALAVFITCSLTPSAPAWAAQPDGGKSAGETKEPIKITVWLTPNEPWGDPQEGNLKEQLEKFNGTLAFFLLA